MKINRNYILNTISTLINMLFPLITMPFILRVFGPTLIGRINYVFAISSYFTILTQSGLAIYASKEISKTTDNIGQRKKIFSELLIMNMFFVFISIVSYFAFLLIDKDLSNYKTLFYFSGINILSNLFFVDWVYSGSENFSFLAFRNIFFKLISIIAIYGLIKNKNDYLIYVLILVLSILIANIISLIKSWSLISISKLHFTDFRRHIKPILLLFFASVVGSVYINLDVFILGYLVGDTYVGYFSLNKKVVSLVIAIVGSLGVILVPRMSYLIKNRLIDQYNELAQLSLNFIYFLGLPAVFLLLALSKEVVYILGGYDFFPSILSLRIMSVQVFLTSLSTFFGFQVLLANNDEKSLLYSNILGSVVNLTINLLLVKSYFHFATSISIVLSEFAVLVTQLLLSKKYRTFRLLSNSIHIYFYGSLLSLLSVLFLNIILFENYILSFIIKLVFAGLVYFFYLIYKNEYFTHKALIFLKGILFNE